MLVEKTRGNIIREGLLEGVPEIGAQFAELVATYDQVLAAAFGKDSLQEVPPEMLSGIRRISIPGAGYRGYLDALALLSLLPHDVTVDISDIMPSEMSVAEQEWHDFWSSTRRSQRDVLGSSIVTYRVANATRVQDFPIKSDMTIVRNVGGRDISTDKPVDKQQVIAVAVESTHPGSPIIVTTLKKDEIAVHQAIMRSLHLNIFYDGETPQVETNFPIRESIHAIAGSVPQP